VLDVGCSFGYGSAAVLARTPEGRTVVGIERDRDLLARARREFPWLTTIEGDAAELPLPDSCADAVLLLDVLEHVEEPGRVLAEAHRVLRPGGSIVLSVPHRGPTRWLDAVNIYSRLRQRRSSWPALDGMVATDDGEHRHYTVAELGALLDEWFAIDRVARTGLGLQELVNLAILTLQVPLRAPRLAQLLAPLHLLVYIADDVLPTGPLAYHLAVRARRKPTGGAA
jgi:SAM-dependent methyltransferase